MYKHFPFLFTHYFNFSLAHRFTLCALCCFFIQIVLLHNNNNDNNNNNNNNNNNKIKANRPDIIIKNKTEKSCLLIDIAIPTNRNSSVKVTKKLSKYKDLEIEIEQMWGMKTTTIQVVIGALGLIKKGMDKYIQKIPGDTKTQELQKITLLGMSFILRKALSIK